jgi:hypothetical protein
MAYFQTLEFRKTFKWVDSSMDEWEYIGKVKVMPTGLLVKDCDVEDRITQGFVVRLPPHELKASYIKHALQTTFSYGGCTHEYDCCGCRSGYSTVRQLSHRKWSVILHSSRNY